MHISNTYQTVANSPLQASRPNNSDAFDVDPAPDTAQLDAVKARYDMTNISAREVDQAAEDLIDAGYRDIVQIGRLLIQGEKWQQQQDIMLAHATRETGVAYDVTPADPTQKLNLVAKAEADIDYLLSSGEDTKHAREFLGFLKSFHGKSGDISTGPYAAAAEAALARQTRPLN